MRAAAYNSPGFVPGDPGNIQTNAEILRYIQDLERRVALAMTALASGHRDMVFDEPAKPRTGDVVYADGTQWNPGSGEGFYYYNSAGLWIQLG